MKSKIIDGYAIRSWFQYGHREVDLHKKHINSINVFPVADGDTGTNLSLTLKAMAERPISTASFGSMVERISESGLANARGNSGMIFAAYVNGMAEEGRHYDTVNLSEYSTLAQRAVAYVYRAVEEPVEGTMISVIRDWAHCLLSRHKEYEFFDDLLQEAYQTAKASLAATPEKLAVLKLNNVVDSGAEGFVRFLRGINLLMGQEIAPLPEDESNETITLLSGDHQSQFRYCTEFLLKNDVLKADEIRQGIEKLGDCLIVSSNQNKTRVHLHTNHPEELMVRLMECGEILEQKVDDMALQQRVQHHRKNSIALLTDSIADLPDKIILDYQIHSVPLTLLINQVPYLDKRTITLKGLFESMACKTDHPTSSQPEPYRVSDALDLLFEHYESVIVITVSEMLSGTYGVFKREAERFEKLGKKVTVINSCLNSGAQGLMVKRAAELLENGCSHEETVQGVQQMIPKTKIYVCLETIENAIRGGRVPKTLGRLAMAMGARPVMTLDSQGRGVAFGVGFSQAGTTRVIMNIVRKINREKGVVGYSIVHADNQPLAEFYADALKNITGLEPEFITEISAVTAIHSGQGCVAVSLIEK